MSGIKDFKNLIDSVNHVVTNIIIPHLEKDGTFTWDTKYTPFKVVNIVTTMLDTRYFKYIWLNEDTLIISIKEEI